MKSAFVSLLILSFALGLVLLRQTTSFFLKGHLEKSTVLNVAFRLAEERTQTGDPCVTNVSK